MSVLSFVRSSEQTQLPSAAGTSSAVFESRCPRDCARWQAAGFPVRYGEPGLPGVAPWSPHQLEMRTPDTKFLVLCQLQNESCGGGEEESAPPRTVGHKEAANSQGPDPCHLVAQRVGVYLVRNPDIVFLPGWLPFPLPKPRLSE